MSMIYSDYNRDRIGWFFGLSGWQLALLAGSALPVAVSLQHGRVADCPWIHRGMGFDIGDHRGPGARPVGHRLVPRLDRVRDWWACSMDALAQ